MTETERIRCGLYARVSTRQQMECEYNSLHSQRDKLEAYCKSQDGYAIQGYYEDGGQSGDSLERPGLQRLLLDIRTGRLDCVLVYKIDRLTRSVKDFHTLMDLFEEHQVDFVSVTQSIDTRHPTGRLLRNILLDFAQFEREMIADRTRDKMRQRAQKGLWNGGTPPFGYMRELKKLKPHQQEADAVRFIFDCFSQDPSITRLRSELHRRAIFSRSGKNWLKTSLSNILHNPVYIGKVQSHGEVFEGEHAAIIDEIMFNRVQSLRPERTHAATRIDRVFPLKRLLKCGDCGSFLTPHYTQKRRKNGSVYRIPYYRCTRTMQHGNSVCSVRSLNADKIEKAIVADLADLSRNEPYLKRCIDELNTDIEKSLEPLLQEQQSLKNRLLEIEREIDRYVLALGRGSVSIVRLEREIVSRQADKILLEQQLEYVEQRIRDSQVTEYDADLVRKNLLDFGTAFQGLNPKEKSEALQCLLKKVTVFEDRIVLEIFDLPEFNPSSQKRPTKLPRLDSNQRPTD